VSNDLFRPWHRRVDTYADNGCPVSNGKFLKIEHFESKANVEQYIRDQDIPSAFVLPGFYLSQMVAWFHPGDDGTWTFKSALTEDAKIPIFAAESDNGKFVKAAFLNRDKVLGKQVLAATEYYTPKQMLADLQSLFPQTVKDVQVSQTPEEPYKETLKGYGMPQFAADELWENMRLVNEDGYYGGASLDWSLSLLDEKPTTWKEYAKKANGFKDLK
jgi:uncharacterized protein YbjT (DUF2867 family)